MSLTFEKILSNLIRMGTSRALEKPEDGSPPAPFSVRLRPQTKTFLECQAEMLGASQQAIAQAILNGIAAQSLAEASPVVDPCFGSYYSEERQRRCVRFANLGALARVMEPRDFSQQLSLLVAQCPNRELVVTDGTSYPAGFEHILKSIVDLQLIILKGRTDVNNAVEKTLGIDFLVPAGVLSLRPHWTAYKEIRAQELLCDLRWLWLEPFRQRTVALDAQDRYLQLQDDYVPFVRTVLSIISDNRYNAAELTDLLASSGWQAVLPDGELTRP